MVAKQWRIWKETERQIYNQDLYQNNKKEITYKGGTERIDKYKTFLLCFFYTKDDI